MLMCSNVFTTLLVELRAECNKGYVKVKQVSDIKTVKVFEIEILIINIWSGFPLI